MHPKGKVSISNAIINKRGNIDAFLDRFAAKHGNITVTSGHRDKSHKLYRKGSMHSHAGKARDIRTKDLDENKIKELIKAAYKKGFTVIDERSRKGAPHLHIDERGKASIMKWNPDIKDAQDITDTYNKKEKTTEDGYNISKEQLDKYRSTSKSFSEFSEKVHKHRTEVEKKQLQR